MNWKLVIVGGRALWVVSLVVGMFGTGLLIHEELLDPVYRAHSEL